MSFRRLRLLLLPALLPGNLKHPSRDCNSHGRLQERKQKVTVADDKSHSPCGLQGASISPNVQRMQTKRIEQLKVGDIFTWAFHENYRVTEIKAPTRINGSTYLLSYIGLETGTEVLDRKMPKKSICEFIKGE